MFKFTNLQINSKLIMRKSSQLEDKGLPRGVALKILTGPNYYGCNTEILRVYANNRNLQHSKRFRRLQFPSLLHYGTRIRFRIFIPPIRTVRAYLYRLMLGAPHLKATGDLRLPSPNCFRSGSLFLYMYAIPHDHKCLARERKSQNFPISNS